MPAVSSLLLPLDLRSCGNFGCSVHVKPQDAWSLYLSNNAPGSLSRDCRKLNRFLCQSQLRPSGEHTIAVLKTAAKIFSRSYSAFHGGHLVFQLAQAVGVIAFASWGLKPVVQYGWFLFCHKSESSWKRSEVHYVVTSYIQPVLLWTGAILLCRALEPSVLPTVASQVVKQRLLTFVRSLSSVLAFAYCLSSLIQQTQKFFAETKDSGDARNMGVEFAGKAIYTAVWVAAISLFIELLGFSTQKWLTAGGLGTVLITLAGREVFTNFLSSIMIHTTRPFILNDWIQTKIEGYEVSGTVEHVGWWSPTVIRGDDREAVHIPNHKFTVNIVRNLSQKTHWRIKTHIAISHLDVNKINNIVADMRKVLSKNPQIEQQKLHRRVFLDNIDKESQALLIMISCFVKTSRFEEYQCVKEAILLDLLRVISHHRARLATPMRTVQKIYRDADAAPFVETIFSRATETAERPFLLVEPQYKIYNDDKSRTSARPLQRNEGKVENSEATPPSDTKVDPKAGLTLNEDNNKVEAGSVSSESDIDSSTKVKVAAKTSDASGQNVEETASKGLLTEKELPLKESSTDEVEMTSTTAHGKQETAEKHVPSSPKTILEENIVLGVALEGSKRMLQIEEEPVPPSATPEGKNMAGLGKDKQEESSQASTAVPSGQRETDR